MIDEMGWDAPEGGVAGGVGPFLFFGATIAYWFAVWIMSGFAPLVYFVTRHPLSDEREQRRPQGLVR